MKLFLLSAFGLCVAMSVAAPPLPTTLETELQKLKKIADERARLFNEFDLAPAEIEAPIALEAPISRAPSNGLRIGGLGKSSLQPASGLHSNARGLTPEDEWRKMFPHKPGYSR